MYVGFQMPLALPNSMLFNSVFFLLRPLSLEGQVFGFNSEYLFLVLVLGGACVPHYVIVPPNINALHKTKYCRIYDTFQMGHR